MKRIPIYSVAAWSGTGKTTFLEKLIPKLRKNGLRVAVIKHDAHDFEIDKEGKDTWRLTRAGADMTLISSDSKAAVMENRPVPIKTLVSYVHDVDVILAEGYKNGDWPKILIYRKAAGHEPALDPETCFAVVTDVRMDCSAPQFGLDDAGAVAKLICRDIDRSQT